MNDIQDYQQRVKETMQLLDKSINRSPLYSTQPKKWETQCKAQINDVKLQIDLLKEQIRKLPYSESAKHSGPLKKYTSQLQNYKREFTKKLRGQSQTGEQQIQEPNKGNRMILDTIAKGDSAQSRMLDGLDSMTRTVEEGITLAHDTNVKLNEQIEQLDRMKDKVKDTQSSLKRAQKHINYFIKALQCDKCLLALIVLIILAAITLIALVVTKH